MSRLTRDGRKSRPTRRVSPLAAAAGGAASVAEAWLALNPITYHKLNDASGNAVDYGSAGLNALPVSTPTYRGIVGPDGDSYASFSTAAARFEIPASTLTSSHTSGGSPTGISVAMLLRDNALQTNSVGYACGRWQTNRYEWSYANQGYNDGNMAAYKFQNLGAIHKSHTVTGGAVVGQWRFVCFTIPPDGSAAEVTHYIDSATPAAGTVGGPTGGEPSFANSKVGIASNVASTSYGLVGSMAHFAIFPGIFNDANVATLYDAAVAEGWVA